jgi:signal transduction histidine kinase
MSLAGMESTLAELRWLMIAMTPFLLIVTAATGYWIASRALAPVDGMTRLARSIGLADLSRRLPAPRTRDELSRLAEAWNEMLERLEGSVKLIQRFTADAAHELRTPLASLRTAAELSLRRERSAGEHRQALMEVAGISARMGELVDQLLTLACGDASHGALKEAVDLGGVTHEACDDMRPLFEAAGVTPSVRVEPEIPLTSGDGASLRHLITALLENGLKYAGRRNRERFDRARRRSPASGSCGYRAVASLRNRFPTFSIASIAPTRHAIAEPAAMALV